MQVQQKSFLELVGYSLFAVSYTHLDVYKRQKVEGETAYCVDINTSFKNGYKTRSDASSRMSSDQIADVALSLEYVKQYTCLLYTSIARIQQGVFIFRRKQKVK